MDNYIVSARKYRPATFDSVVGQRALTTTLKNAIKSQKLAHAYLFCGPRGVGKTTCARIFAKTINCLSPEADGEPCNKCESCVAFNEQRSYNIYELDAASNNSVDDMRSLVEQVRIPPQIGRYKVYIIDEVHMLSTQAFNAFLKTLEEPPAHAVFILATTEKHKILPTILSRCQIYDFSRMSVEDIVNHLTYVVQTEGYTAEPEALNVIALKADGGMRDALSIFDQVVSFTGGNITYEKVIEDLNVLDYEYYFRLTEMLLENKISDALLLFNEVLSKGFEGDHFITGLASHFRDLLVSRDASTLPLLQVGASIRQRYSEQAAKCQPQFLYKAMKLCNDCDMSYRASKNRRLLVELTLIQVAQAAAGDDDLSGGRSPKRQLKPIFSAAQGAQPADGQSAAAPQSSTSAQQPAAQPQQPASQAAWQQPAPAQQKQQAQQGQAPAQQQPAAQTTADPSSQYQTAVHQPSGSLAEQLRGGGQNATHKVPLMSRNSLSFSIKGGAQQNAATQQQPGGAQQPMPGAQTAAGMPQPMAGAQQNGGAQPSAGAGPATDKPFTDRELNYYWQFYAGQLPKEYVATARRMQMIRPALQPDGVTFSITVDNELTERNFKEMSRDITTYLRKCLQNNRVQMTIRISEATEAVRPVGRVERFQMMAKKNPSLLKLRQELGLELY